ncbi:DNA adenine methylase [Candidatus Pacearchaeota archaeon]|nr:DNA adenine methylase [Candidatus Pacearchaeota archaeon]
MRPVMRYHGAKFRLAKWIMSFFPKHEIYVEPYSGSAGVLMQKKKSISEVYNDLDGDIQSVFSVLQDKKLSKELQKLLLVTPYSRREFETALIETDDIVERARRTIIRAQMGFGSAGATKKGNGFRIDSARKYATATQLWAEYPASIASFCERLQGVIIENRPALKVLENHDTEKTLFYVDPPYQHSTRSMGSSRQYYRHEMTDLDHEALLKTLLGLDGFVVLSGYDNRMYQDMLHGWQKYSTESRISAQRGTKIRIECVWLNPAAHKKKPQQELFN